VRLLLMAIAIRLFVPAVDLPLAERRFWAFVAAVLAIVGGVGLLLAAIDLGERYLLRNVRSGHTGESRALLKLVRRVLQGLVIAGGFVVGLQWLGLDPTAALAGLGIGGIAIALAAQKTLENVIGGFSLVFDKAIRVGDVLKVGEMVGTVDHVGLRSTRIRTLDRTVVTVPNGQIATASIETLSVRDKFWFHHTVGLTYAARAPQIRDIRDAFERLLLNHPSIDAPSVRVRFLRLGPYSLDIELFAYLYAPDYEAFLTLQGELLIKIMEIVESAGAAIAFPSQTLHVANTLVPS
jgi:MscS family membrane protein